MSVFNPSLFIGEVVFGATAGAPLSADASGNLVSGISTYEVTATASATAPTGADVLLNSMTITPAAGTYLAMFSTDITSGDAGAAISVSFYNNGTQNAASLRKVIPFSGGALTSGSGRGAVAMQRIITVTTGAVEVRWSTSNSGPTAAARTMTLVRIS